MRRRLVACPKFLNSGCVVPPSQEQLPFLFAVAPTSRAEIYLGPGQVAQLHGAPAAFSAPEFYSNQGALAAGVVSKMLLSVMTQFSLA